MRKILFLVLLIEFSVLVIVIFAYEKTSAIKTTYREMDLFEGNFPASIPKKIESNGWAGYSFKEDFHFYWKTSTDVHKTVTELMKKLATNKNVKYIYLPAADTCIFLFRPLRKGYSVICILTLDTLAVWIESKSKNTTLDTKFEFMVHFINSLKIKGIPVVKEPITPYAREFRRNIPIWFLQPQSTFFLFLIGIIILSNIITFVVLVIGGKMPKEIDPEWDIVTPNVIIHESKYLRNTFYSGCVAKKQNQILIYTFGKLRTNINLSELQNPPIFQGNKLVISKNLKIEFPDYDSLIKWQAALS